MDEAGFSDIELSYLAKPTWFKGLRMLEAHPGLATADFSWRVMVAAEECGDPARASVLSQTARLIGRVVTVGVDAATKEKLGESGALAGFAREARDRYYESRDPHDLLQALDAFHRALLHDDDPIRYGSGDTLQGFAATLSDLKQLVQLPLLEHVQLLAFLASITVRVAGVPPAPDPIWSDPFSRALVGVRRCLDSLEQLPLAQRTADFYESVRQSCEALDDVLRDGPPEPFRVLAAAMPVVSLALTCTRAEVPPPPAADAPVDAKLEPFAQLWLVLVLRALERYGSDYLRFTLARPLDGPEALLADVDPDHAAPAAPAPLEPDADFAAFADGVAQLLDEKLAAMAAGDGAELLPAVDELLFMAVRALPWAPEQARTLARTAGRRLEAREVTEASERSDPAELLSSHATLAALTTAVNELVDVETPQVQRFNAIRAALPAELAETVAEALRAGLLEEVRRARPEEPSTARMLMLTHLAVVLRDLAAVVAVNAVDAALPNSVRYREIRDRFDELLTGEDERPSGFLVHPDVPGQEDMQDLVTRFQVDLASLEIAEADEVAVWLGAAYEAGGLTFASVENELVLLNNLGWIAARVMRPDAPKWTARARRLALEQRAWTFLATADINAASWYSSAIDRWFSTWSVDAEQAAGRIGSAMAGLAHAAEALRVVSGGAGLSDPTDRYFVHSAGFPEIRMLIEGLLMQARDAALLAEYLLNARGMWFLMDLYAHDPSASSHEALDERAVVSWRDRCWLSLSLAVDEVLQTTDPIPYTELEQILAPASEPDALWFGNVFDNVSSTLASVLIVPPKEFVAAFEALDSPFATLDAAPCLDVAASLGALLPVELWQLAHHLCRVEERRTLFVSLAGELPPVSMGLWRCSGEGEARVIADAFDVVYCPMLGPRPGAVRWTEQTRAAQPHAFAVCDPLGDLPEARIVPRLAEAVCGNGAGNAAGYPPANRETVLALLEACARTDGVFVYQGHSESGALEDPGAASLLLEPMTLGRSAAERLSMGESIGTIQRSALGRMPRRAAFLSCGSGVARQSYDATGVAMAALAGGSEAVVSTLQPISDDGPWSTLVDELVESLCAAEPWRAFGRWQRQIALQLEDLDEHARRTIASLAMFGAPFVRPVSVGAAA